jgi:hypothetical protein
VNADQCGGSPLPLQRAAVAVSEWEPLLDAKSGNVYYHNLLTDETVWELSAGAKVVNRSASGAADTLVAATATPAGFAAVVAENATAAAATTATTVTAAAAQMATAAAAVPVVGDPL